MKFLNKLRLRSYTFVEVLVIVAVIGIIAAVIVLKNISSTQRLSFDTEEEAIIASLGQAITRDYAEDLQFYVPDSNQPAGIFDLLDYPPDAISGVPQVPGGAGLWVVGFPQGDKDSQYLDIYCPHIDDYNKPTIGQHWRYYYSGSNQGKIILEADYGH